MNKLIAGWQRRVGKATRRVVGIGLLASLLAPSLVVRGGEPPLSSYGFKGMEEVVSVDYHGIDISEAFKFFVKKGNLNIVSTKEAVGTVNLQVDKVSLAVALEAVLAANRLAYRVKGDIIQVMSDNEYRALTGVSFYDDRQMKVFKLKHAAAKDVAAMLQPIKSERGEIVFDNAKGTLIIRDLAAKLAEMEQVIELVDEAAEELATEIFVLQYSKLEEVQAEVAKALSKDTGTLRTDKRTKTLIVTDTPERMEKIRAIVAAFDSKTKSVFIEARIVTVTLSEQFKFGIDWAQLSKWTMPIEVIGEGVYLNDLWKSVDHNDWSGVRTDSDGNPKVSTRMKTIGAVNQNVVLDLLDTFGDTKLISDPRITVESGKEAILQVVTSEAYEAGKSEVDSGGVTTSYTNFEFVDVGVTLSVLPEINDEGYISMHIKPEVSSIASWYGGEDGPANARQAGSVPIIKRSTAQTTLTVKDGTTVMIAGLIEEGTEKSISKVPILGNIYGIGRLFTHTSDVTSRRETIIFLTPHIVTGDESLDAGAYSQPSLIGGGKEMKGLKD